MNPAFSVVDEWARSAPENLLFVSSHRLLECIATKDIWSAHTLHVFVAELIARWSLSAETAIDHDLGTMLGSDWDDFKDWYRIECSYGIDRTVPDRFWRGQSAFALACESVVRHRVAALFAVDGFIPIIENGSDAAFVPFTLEAADHMELLDAESCRVLEWQSPFDEALAGEKNWRCRLYCRVNRGLPKFTGRSLMLPVKMAVWRRSSKLPLYDTLRVVATGAFDSLGKLIPVDDDLKIRGFVRAFRRGLFFCPWSATAADDPAVVRRIDDRGSVDNLATILAVELEGSGLVRMNLKYVLDRLPDIERDVRFENYNRWGRIVDRVSAMLGAVDEARCPEQRLLLLMLKCAALRHSGHTTECEDLTSKALQLARMHGWESEILRLQIESLVLAQDDGDFDSVLALGDALKNRIAEFAETPASLAMRFYGTMGQAHVWGSLIGIHGFSREEAGSCFKKALEYAYEVGDESEIAKDLNYNHLWYSFFDPDSQEENDAFVRAKNQIERNLSCPKTQHANMHFLLRQRSVALIQGWKRSGRLPSKKTIEEVVLPLAAADGWLCASNRRCVGALLAAHGLVKDAVKAFEDGDLVLPTQACLTSPVLSYVRMGLLTQAAVSLASIGENVLSARYIEKAEELYRYMAESRLFSSVGISNWMISAKNGIEPRNLPNVYY